MTRRIKPENQALQDRIQAVLADAWPDPLTSTQVAERVGGMRTIWEVCHQGKTYTNYEGRTVACRCLADDGNKRFPATHHPGPVPQDSWEIPWDAMAMNPHLNRLARDGVLQKIKVQALRGVLWRWAGDTDGPDVLAQLQALWSLPDAEVNR